MLVLKSPSGIKPLKLPNIVCALGVFDGVHLGHQKVIKTIVRDAKQTSGTSTVITFDNHPYTILNPSYQKFSLTSTAHKLQLFDKLGIDMCILIKFNKNIASISAENWIKEVLWEQLHINSIYIGKDSFFGKNREGNIDLLRLWGNRLGFNVNAIEPVRIDKVPVSSTLIRNNIRRGNLESSKKFLGRDYSIYGAVVKGKGRGGEMGLPTANLNTENQCLPLNGVYAVWTRFLRKEFSNEPTPNNKPKPAVANIGIRPTFTQHKQPKNSPVLEVHLLEETSKLYKKDLEVIFIKRLRDEIQFNTASQLTKQIEKDIISAKKILC